MPTFKPCDYAPLTSTAEILARAMERLERVKTACRQRSEALPRQCKERSARS